MALNSIGMGGHEVTLVNRCGDGGYITLAFELENPSNKYHLPFRQSQHRVKTCEAQPYVKYLVFITQEFSFLNL
jgi:hypothetical protein